jgi:hypothetical protein
MSCQLTTHDLTTDTQARRFAHSGRAGRRASEAGEPELDYSC